MLISLGNGLQLTSDGRIVPAGPCLHSLGAGMRLTTGGAVVREWPKYDPPARINGTQTK